MKVLKVLLTQNIQRAINNADRCGKIPLGRWVPDMCANVIRHSVDNDVTDSERNEDENDDNEEETIEDGDKQYVLGNIVEELD